MGSTHARPFPIPAPVAKTFYGLQKRRLSASFFACFIPLGILYQRPARSACRRENSHPQ